MRAVTLICGIVFAVNAALSIYTYAQMYSQFHMAPVQSVHVGVTVLGECCLAAFFFILYSRQK